MTRRHQGNSGQRYSLYFCTEGKRGQKKHYIHHAYIFLQDSSLGFLECKIKMHLIHICIHLPSFLSEYFIFFKIICIEYDVLNARFKYCPLTEGIRVERSRILHADTLDNFSLISCQDYGTFLL